MMTTYAITDGTKVLGFFEDEDEGPIQSEFVYKKTAEYIYNYPPANSPTDELHIDSEGYLYWVETASLEDLKARKNAEINAARLKANRTFFPYQGKQIACDELSRSDIDAVNGIIAITQSLPPGWVGGWKAIDNTYVPITTVAQWVGFYAAMVTQGSSNFAHAQSLKTTLAAATTANEIASITWAN